jgi:hypothetical protein
MSAEIIKALINLEALKSVAEVSCIVELPGTE